MQIGQFIISLDFELFWGVRDKRTLAGYGGNIKGVRQVIPALLQIFDQYQVKATFATVGFLFCRNKTEILKYRPFIQPQYSDKKMSPYEDDYLQSIGESEKDDIFHYGFSLVELLKQHPQHEIASHTFSHFYCLENASLQAFEEDLIAAQKVAAENGIVLKSIVFPRNQYSEEHLAICKRLNFSSFRGNEESSIYQPRSNRDQNKFIRAVRLLDSYVNLTGHHTFSVKKGESPVNIPASRFLRPFSKRLRFLDPLRLKRIKDSMTYAAQKGEAFHLWWHPHNFGTNLQENLRFLENILRHFQFLQQTYDMRSATMQQIVDESKSHHAEAINHLISR